MNVTNWKTTLGGALVFVAGLLQLVPVPEKYKWVSPALGYMGGAVIGLAAKDSTTHSTADQVQVATVVEKAKV